MRRRVKPHGAQGYEGRRSFGTPLSIIHPGSIRPSCKSQRSCGTSHITNASRSPILSERIRYIRKYNKNLKPVRRSTSPRRVELLPNQLFRVPRDQQCRRGADHHRHLMQSPHYVMQKSRLPKKLRILTINKRTRYCKTIDVLDVLRL